MHECWHSSAAYDREVFNCELVEQKGVQSVIFAEATFITNKNPVI